MYRVLKPDTHFYLLCDAETMFVAKPEAEKAGFRFWKPLVWDKRTIGMGYHYRARYELILFFEKGKRRLNDLGIADIIEVPRIRGGYPAEKPVEVAEVLIRQSTQPGDVVADPFMGSGSVGVAAAKLGRRFLGNDLNPEAVQISARRLHEVGASGTAPASPANAEPTQADLLDSATRHDQPAAQAARCPASMTGAEYANLVAFYVARRFESRGLKAYREVRVGKTIIAKNRCIDILCVGDNGQKAFAIECKFQDSQGTVDEKIPYALDDLQALPMAGCIAYAGSRLLGRRAAHARRLAARRVLPARSWGRSSQRTTRVSSTICLRFTSDGGIC